MVSHQNIKWPGKANQIAETMSGKNCRICCISLFSWVDMHSNILKLWKNGEEFWNGVFCMRWPGALARWFIYPALPNYTLRKNKCNFPTFSGVEFSLFYLYSNFWVLRENREQCWNRVFLHVVTNSTGKMKCTSKLIYLHSSQKETQLPTVRFFRNWVYYAALSLWLWTWTHLGWHIEVSTFNFGH